MRLVEQALQKNDLRAVGEALYTSHESSRVNFNNSIQQLDFLVHTLKQLPHVYGARLTGGGFGGAVMAYTNAAFGESEADAVSLAYKKEFGIQATILHTSAGSGATLL